jgi:hypothetical protein
MDTEAEDEACLSEQFQREALELIYQLVCQGRWMRMLPSVGGPPQTLRNRAMARSA